MHKMTNKEFTDQNFRQLCDVVKSIYSESDQIKAIGWNAQTPVHHIEGAVVAEIHSRMDNFIGKDLAVEDRERAGSGWSASGPARSDC